MQTKKKKTKDIMEYSKDEKDKIEKLSPFCRIIHKKIEQWLHQIINGECNICDIEKSISDIKNYSDGFVKEDDYLTVDKACRMLNCCRSRFYDYYVFNYNLKNYKFNNIQIGYKKSEILKIINTENT